MNKQVPLVQTIYTTRNNIRLTIEKFIRNFWLLQEEKFLIPLSIKQCQKFIRRILHDIIYF
jgi:hypothetical protein